MSIFTSCCFAERIVLILLCGVVRCCSLRGKSFGQYAAVSASTIKVFVRGVCANCSREDVGKMFLAATCLREVLVIFLASSLSRNENDFHQFRLKYNCARIQFFSNCARIQLRTNCTIFDRSAILYVRAEILLL